MHERIASLSAAILRISATRDLDAVFAVTAARELKVLGEPERAGERDQEREDLQHGRESRVALHASTYHDSGNVNGRGRSCPSVGATGENRLQRAAGPGVARTRRVPGADSGAGPAQHGDPPHAPALCDAGLYAGRVGAARHVPSQADPLLGRPVAAAGEDDDTRQVPHGFAGPREELWLVGTLGLQLWNSIRVVDYLASLPDVDDARIGVTGASGGATQGFLLAAVDDRVGYSAPVNMVSFLMQGGSPCENAPLLRIDTHNVEFAAAFAPKPQLLVSATGDWTVNTPAEEFPAVQDIYRLLDAGSNVEWRQFDSPHNYHRDSREAVYGFFGRHILGDPGAARFVERGYSPEQLSSLLYLWGRGLPARAVGLQELVRQRIAAAEADTAALAVSDAGTLERARTAFRERLGLSIHAEALAPDRVVMQRLPGGALVLGRRGAGDRIPAKLVNGGPEAEGTDPGAEAGTGPGPRAGSDAGVPTLLVHPEGAEAAERSAPGRILAARGAPLLLIDAFQTGAAVAGRDVAGAGRNAEAYYHVFNRSDDANRVQDILTAIAFLRRHTGAETVNVVGTAQAGLWVLLAAALDPGELTVAVDLDRFDAADDAAYVDGLFIPGLRRAGDVRAAAPLLSRGRLLLHNVHARFPLSWFEASFEAAGRSGSLRTSEVRALPEALVAWLES